MSITLFFYKDDTVFLQLGQIMTGSKRQEKV